MRNRFNEQLEQLNVELIKLGALCEQAISVATKAFLEYLQTDDAAAVFESVGFTPLYE